MQVALAQLATHLNKGVQALYTVWGDETLLALEAVDAIRTQARAAGHLERSVHTVMGAHFDWGAVLAAAQSQSLFADKQILELRIPSGKPGKEGAPVLEQLARSASEDNTTVRIITLPSLDKATRSSAWFEALERHGTTITVPTIERTALPQWIAQRLARNQQSVAAGESGQQALEFFADCVEGHLLAAHQEVQKLALLYPPGELSLEQIQHAVLNLARYELSALSQAVLNAHSTRALRVLAGLRAEGQAEVLVHWTLAEDVRALYKLRQLLGAGKPLPLALQEARIWGPRQRWLERAVPRWSLAQASTLLKAAQVVDGIVKGLKAPGWPHEPWAALTRLALMICAGPAKLNTLGAPSVGK